MSNLLTVKHLTKNFGGLSAVSNVSIHVNSGELLGLIGPNGAGKTTFFNLLTGVYAPTSGEIVLQKESETISLLQKKPDEINGLGLARTFQNIRLFSNLSVIENVMVAMHRHKGIPFFHSMLRTPAYYANEDKLKASARELLEVFGLEPYEEWQAKNLPYGDQRKLEIIRALATKPKILFLDEPAAGMNPKETEELTIAIAQIRDRFNLSVVLIEHDMNLVMQLCERIYVLEYGRLLAEGTPEAIRNNPDVIKAYLGGE